MEMTARAVFARSQRVADGVTFIEDDEGSGLVFLWGRAAWRWDAGDRAARRLAAVQLVESKAARQRQVAAAFGVNEDSLILWRGEYATNGVAGLASRRPGPKGPSKLTEAKHAEIGALRAAGMTLAAVAERVGVSTDTVRRALADAPLRGRAPTLVPMPHRRPAPTGSISHVPAVVCEGTSLPLAGAMIIVPPTVSTGLLDAPSRVYDAPDGLDQLLLSMVFACLLDHCMPDIDALAALGHGDRLIDALARRHLETHDDVEGIFSFDGRTRCYRRGVELSAVEMARIRLSLGAGIDARLLDGRGDGVLTWTTRPDGSDELQAVTTTIRDLVGPDARPAVCFERSGWTPRQLAELTATGFDVVAYSNGRASTEPDAAFGCHRLIDESGRSHDYLLADSEVHLGYHGGRRRFSCRQITHLDARSGHQTKIITTRRDVDPATIVHAMSAQWSHDQIDDCMRTRLRRHDDAGDDCSDALAPERRRIHDAVSLATQTAESALARSLARQVGTGDAALGLLRDVFRSPADVLVIGDELHVRLEARAAAPQHTLAIAALCDDLTSTATRCPATDLTLVYSMGAADRSDDERIYSAHVEAPRRPR